MAKAINKKKVVIENKVLMEVQEPSVVKPQVAKIHLSKYFVLHSMTVMQKAFLTASPFHAEMHTEVEWEKIISNALNRRVE